MRGLRRAGGTADVVTDRETRERIIDVGAGVMAVAEDTNKNN